VTAAASAAARGIIEKRQGKNMTFQRLIKLVVATALLVGAMAPSANADPLVITGGILRYLPDEPAFIQISFGNGSANIGWEDETGGWLPDFTVAGYFPGDRIDVSTDESFPTQGGGFFGELRLGSELYSVTMFEFAVDAVRDVIVPPFGDSQFISFTGIPFNFHGRVSAISADQRTLATDFIGAGSATLLLDVVRLPSDEFASLDHVVYTFERTPTPVPEPTSLLLVGAGLGAIGTRSLRRKRSSAS